MKKKQYQPVDSELVLKIMELAKKVCLKCTRNGKQSDSCSPGNLIYVLDCLESILTADDRID